MKKNRYITLSIVLLCLLAALAGGVRLFRYYLPHEGPTDALYEKYKDNPQVKASLLHDFRVNDTLAVDVTTLQATDSVGWETLKKDFRLLPLPEFQQKKIDQEIDVISMFLAPKADPTLPMDTTDLQNNNVISVSRLHRTISIFHTKTIAEQKAVKSNQYETHLP